MVTYMISIIYNSVVFDLGFRLDDHHYLQDPLYVVPKLEELLLLNTTNIITGKDKILIHVVLD